MTIYSVHIRDSSTKPDLAVIPDGFSWGAMVFGFIWALYIGAWDLALVVFVGQALLGALISALIVEPGAQAMAQLGLAVAIGFGAGELRRVLLGLRGLAEAGVVTGQDRQDAERRYLDGHPAITQRLLGNAA